MDKFLTKLNISSNSWVSDLIWLILISTLFYIIYLGGYPLFVPDEGRYSEVAREMITSGDYITPRIAGVPFLDKPVLYYWLQATAMRWFGVHEWALRLFPCLFGLFGIVMTYSCGRQLYDRNTGLIAAIILATTPLYFIAAHYANLDLEVAVLISVSLLCFLVALQRKTKYFLILMCAYCFSSLAFLTKGLIGIAFPGMIVLTWICLQQRFNLIKKLDLPYGILIFVLICGPWYYLVQRANPDFFNYFFITQQVSRFVSTENFNNQTPFWFYVPVVLLGFFPWCIFLYYAFKDSWKRLHQNTANAGNDLFLWLWIGMVFTFFSVPHSKVITYILPIFPPLSLLTARTIKAHWKTKKNHFYKYTLFTYLFICLSLSIAIVSLPFIIKSGINKQAQPYLYIFAIIILASGICSLVYKYLSKNIKDHFLIYATTSVVLLLSLTFSATYFNTGTTKPLNARLATLIHPDDEVVNYYKYYQDVPLYLQKKVTVVANWDNPNIINVDNWQRELWYGLKFQKKAQQLITEKTFWHRWHSQKRMFVYVDVKYFNQFKEGTTRYFYVDKYNNVLVFSNKPVVTTLLS